MEPTELPDWEEAHYFHTIQYFNELCRRHGVKMVLDDLKNLDLDTYLNLHYHVMGSEKKEKATAVLLKDPYFRDANQD